MRNGLFAVLALVQLIFAGAESTSGAGSANSIEKVRWEEMFPEEMLAKMDAVPVCYMAYGLAEPHGAYSALGLDYLKAYALCERAAKAHGGILAPPMAWHVQEQPHFDWFGKQGVKQPLASSLPIDLFLHVVLYHLRSFDARGFHVAILITGHYGGIEKDISLICEYYRRRTGTPMLIHCAADHELMTVDGYEGDHAGVTETSQLMAIRPDLIDLKRDDRSSPNGPWAGVNFQAGTKAPSRRIGERLVASQVLSLGQISARLLSQYVKRRNYSAPTLTDVEALWVRFEQKTRKYWWAMQTYEEWQRRDPNAVPRFPGWDAIGE